jgi:hypothetical protein
MEYFETLALDKTGFKPTIWLRYINDIVVVWPHGPARLQDFLHHVNTLRPIIQFTVDTENKSNLPFLGVLVTNRG